MKLSISSKKLKNHSNSSTPRSTLSTCSRASSRRNSSKDSTMKTRSPTRLSTLHLCPPLTLPSKLENALANDTMTLAQEKALNKKLASLKTSMPFISQYGANNKAVKELTKQRREVQKQINELFKTTINPLKADQKTVDDKIDALIKEGKEKRGEGEPEIKTQKDQFRDEFKAIRDRKKATYKEWDAKWDNYFAQQRQIKYIQWATKQKQFLLKKKAREDELKRMLAEKEELIDEYLKNPYANESAEIMELTNYCKLLMPKSEEEA